MFTRSLFVLLATLLVQPAVADLGRLDPTWGDGGVIREPSCGEGCLSTVAAIAPSPEGRTLLLVRRQQRIGVTSTFDFEYRVQSREPDGRHSDGFTSRLLIAGRGWQDEGAMVRQADGRILVAALQSTNCNDSGCEQWLNVVRLMPDGTYDTSFGSLGRFAMLVDSSPVRGLGLQPDGKIIVATGRLLRLDTTGKLDASFANDGQSPFVWMERAQVLPDGRILTSLVWEGEIRFSRFTEAGQPDPGFGGDGNAAFAIAGGVISPAIAIQEGRIVVSGRQSEDLLLLRVTDEGAADESFGPGGIRRYAAGSFTFVSGLHVDGAQRIVAFGSSHSLSQEVLIRRWLADGTPDTIDGDMMVHTGAGGSIASSVLLPNSKAIVGLYSLGTLRLGANALQSDREFALQQYRDFLAREGDAGGVGYWHGQLASGITTRAAMIESFLTSPEFGGRIAPVMRLYFAYFLRVPDFGGLQFWVGQSGTVGLEGISDFFANSTEFAARYGSTTHGEYVDLVYQNVLGRAPDAGGRAFWIGQLDSGARTRGQVMLAFSESTEFQATSRNEVLVAMAYAGMLRREPDAGGFGFWVDYLDDGNSPQALIAGFLAAPEYEARFAP